MVCRLNDAINNSKGRPGLSGRPFIYSRMLVVQAIKIYSFNNFFVIIFPLNTSFNR
jgi:hypothetical protein